MPALTFTPEVTFTKKVRVLNSPFGWVHLVALFGCLFAYVLSMLYTGFHLQRNDVAGRTNIMVQPPARGCAPEPFSDCKLALHALKDLPYCKQSSLSYSGPKLPCVYMASASMNTASEGIDDGAMIPTNTCNTTGEYQVDDDDKVGAEEPSTLEKDYSVHGNHSWRDICSFVAESSRYWVYLAHYGAFYVRDRSRHVKRDRTRGFYTNAEGEEIEILARHNVTQDTGEELSDKDLPHVGDSGASAFAEYSVVISNRGRFRRDAISKASRAVLRSDSAKKAHLDVEHWDYDGIVKGDIGDVVQAKSLLKLANLSLDSLVHSGRSELNEWTNRYCGVTIEIGVEYVNKERWMGWKITPFWDNEILYRYTVDGYHHSDPCSYSYPKWIPKVGKKGDRRSYSLLSGIELHMKVSGSIYEWDSWKFCMSISILMSVIGLVQLTMHILLLYSTSWYEGQKFEVYDAADDVK